MKTHLPTLYSEHTSVCVYVCDCVPKTRENMAIANEHPTQNLSKILYYIEMFTISIIFISIRCSLTKNTILF